MQIQITAAPDPALIVAATRHGLRRPVLIARLVGCASLVAAVFAQLATGEPSMGLLVAGAMIAGVAPMVLINHVARDAMNVSQRATFEITEAGVASSGAESRHSYAWRAIRSVEVLSGQLVFRLAGFRMLMVPTEALSADEIERVVELATANGLAVHRRSQEVGQVRKLW